MTTFSGAEPTTILRFVNRDGRFILQQWWGLKQLSAYDSEWRYTGSGYWEDVPVGPDTAASPGPGAAWRPIDDDT